MPAAILAVVVDCGDARAVAEFWSTVLGRRSVERLPGEYRVGEPGSDDTVLYFMDVPEPKAAKNRLHLDVITQGRLEDEVDRLHRLGATLIEYRVGPQATADAAADRWAVLTDPEGNEFCVTSTSTLSDWPD